MDAFKIPQSIPQDLLLIQDIVGIAPGPAPSVPKSHLEDDHDCSSSDASQDEIEAVLTMVYDDNDEQNPMHVPNSPTAPFISYSQDFADQQLNQTRTWTRTQPRIQTQIQTL